MILCSNCGARMAELFLSLACSAECDLNPDVVMTREVWTLRAVEGGWPIVRFMFDHATYEYPWDDVHKEAVRGLMAALLWCSPSATRDWDADLCDMVTGALSLTGRTIERVSRRDSTGVEQWFLPLDVQP